MRVPTPNDKPTIYVADANVLIDVQNSGVGATFFLIGTVVTSDLVYRECLKYPASRTLIGSALTFGRLTKRSLDELQLQRAATAMVNDCISLPDASVYVLALDEPGTLLTSDATLVQVAKRNDVDTHGLIYVLQQMLSQDLIDHAEACQYLVSWKETNSYAPLGLIKEFLDIWRGKL